MTVRLGDILVRNGVITPDQRDAILRAQQGSGRPFGVLAEELFHVSPKAVVRAWAEQYGHYALRIDPRLETIEPRARELVTRRQVWQFRVMPIKFMGDELLLCTTVEHLPKALRFAGWRLGVPSEFAVAEPMALGEAMAMHFPMDGMSAEVVAGPVAVPAPDDDF